MKVRFFVAETELPKFSIGTPVRISCDGCSGDLNAKVYFIATAAEYTPPVIYSQEERAEARLSRAGAAGQSAGCSIFASASR